MNRRLRPIAYSFLLMAVRAVASINSEAAQIQTETGEQAYDRTHNPVVNYNFNLPSLIKRGGNKPAGGVLNCRQCELTEVRSIFSTGSKT